MGFSGNYKGIIKSRGIKKSTNGATQFCVKVELTQKLVDKKYQKIQHEPEMSYEVWGNLNLINCDGSINNAQLKSLKQSLKWDGASLKALNEIDVIGKEFPVVCVLNDDGKSKISWINSDDIVVADIDSIEDDWRKKFASNVKDFG